MKGASPIGKEWYEQAAAFVEKMIGKTVADIEAITTEEKNGHQVATDADLYAACTMDITAFKAAFIAACKDDQAKTFTAAEGFKLGLDVETDVSGSTDAGEKNATAQLYSTFGAIVVDADGKTIPHPSRKDTGRYPAGKIHHPFPQRDRLRTRAHP